MVDWLQDLFDLMCNEKIRLTVTGEMGEVDATLEIISTGKAEMVAEVVGAGDFEEAVKDLMKQYRAS